MVVCITTTGFLRSTATRSGDGLWVVRQVGAGPMKKLPSCPETTLQTVQTCLIQITSNFCFIWWQLMRWASQLQQRWWVHFGEMETAEVSRSCYALQHLHSTGSAAWLPGKCPFWKRPLQLTRQRQKKLKNDEQKLFLRLLGATLFDLPQIDWSWYA